MRSTRPVWLLLVCAFALAASKSRLVEAWSPTAGDLLIRPSYFHRPALPDRIARSLAGPVHAVALDRGGHSVAALLGDGIIQVADVSTGLVTGTFEVQDSRVSELRWELDDRAITVVTVSGLVRWDRDTRRIEASTEGHDVMRGTPIACSRDGRFRACETRVLRYLYTDEPAIDLWEAGKTKPTARIASGLPSAWRAPLKTLQSAAYLPYAVARPWAAGGLHSRHMDGAAFSPDGSRLATVCEERVRIWAIPEGKRIGSAHSPSGPAHRERSAVALEFSPGGQLLAVGASRTIRLLDGRTASSRDELTTSVGPICGMAFRPDGLELAVIDGGALELWDLAQGRRRVTVRNIDSCCALAYSADGKTIATAGEDSVCTWMGATGRSLGRIPVAETE